MTIILTESLGTLPSLSTSTDQVIFEEYEFERYRRCPPQMLAAYTQPNIPDASLVIDVGFNATYVVPVINSVNAIESGIRRLDVGGKMLTNYLKEIVSYRYYNMMEESTILNRVKESTCFTSLDFKSDLNNWHRDHLRKTHSKFAIGYELPSSHEDLYGHVIDDVNEAVKIQKSGDRQVLILENERFSVPEALFDPLGHLGVNQAPLPEIVNTSILASPEMYQPLMWSNIVLCGGTANLPNFKERLESEIRKFAPCDIPLNIHTSSNNTETAWEGASRMAQDDEFIMDKFTISRTEYLEQGPSHVQKKFQSTNRWNPKTGPPL